MNANDISLNYINGRWQPSSATELLPVVNPATAETLGLVPLSPPAEVAAAAQAAAEALVEWRRTPNPTRIQYLFRLKNLLEEQFEELSRTITMECGKTFHVGEPLPRGDRDPERHPRASVQGQAAA